MATISGIFAMQQKIFEGTPQEANRYLKAHRFPASQRVMIYLDDESADLQVNVGFLFEDVEATGGISAEAANEMDENSKQFKEEF